MAGPQSRTEVSVPSGFAWVGLDRPPPSPQTALVHPVPVKTLVTLVTGNSRAGEVRFVSPAPQRGRGGAGFLPVGEGSGSLIPRG